MAYAPHRNSLGVANASLRGSLCHVASRYGSIWLRLLCLNGGQRDIQPLPVFIESFSGCHSADIIDSPRPTQPANSRSGARPANHQLIFSPERLTE